MVFRRRCVSYFYIILMMGLSGSVWSKDAEPGFLIVGPGWISEYKGSDDYSLVPFIVSQFSIQDTWVEVEGLTARVTAYESPGWTAGGALDLDFGRGSDVENKLIAQFDDIDASVNLGGFLRKSWSNLFLEGDGLEWQASAFRDVLNSHDGSYLRLSSQYSLPLMIPFKLDFELEVTAADESYMDTFFGVSAADSLSSGLSQYETSGGLLDVSFNTNVGLFTSPKRGAFLRLGVTQLLGDAKDSPITESGDDVSYFVGLGYFYRFGDVR